MAQIEKDYVKYHLGNWETEEEAAHAYDYAAKQLFGEFAGGLNNVSHKLSFEQVNYIEFKVRSLINKRKSALRAKGM